MSGKKNSFKFLTNAKKLFWLLSRTPDLEMLSQMFYLYATSKLKNDYCTNKLECFHCQTPQLNVSAKNDASYNHALKF